MEIFMRIVQISDTHLYADKQEELLGVKTFESFLAVVNLLKADKNKPDMIILTGDISQDNSEQAYRHVADILKEFKVPVYFVLGNHDDSDVIKRLFPLDNISDLKNIIVDRWNLILLDSQLPGYVKGHLDKSQLDYMQTCLEKYPDHHAIVMFHHQPIPVGSAWLDQYILTNADEFWRLIKKCPQLKTIFFGHVHQVHESQKQGVKCYSAPSTCIQFMRNKDDFSLENLNPGYRWIELSQDGELKTGVCRVPHYIGTFQADAKGYK